eukprot:NODE_268_length_11281_cov_0.363799.p3 type:complete len:600 gc:universal NODE_268_length_11281_cov_0.363799:8967-10766(+)
MLKTPELQTAVQNFLVNCVGAGFLIIIYFSVSLLSPYIIPLFWAVVLSIPLYDIKKIFLDYIEEDLKDDEITLFGVLTTTIHVILGWACDPFYYLICTITKSYLSLIHYAFNVKDNEEHVQSPSSVDPNLSPGKRLAEKSMKEQKQIVSERLRDTFNKGTFYYFRILLSCGTGYLLYDLFFVKKAAPLLSLLLLFLISLHLIYHVIRSLFVRYLHVTIKQYFMQMTKSKTKNFVLNNANTLLTHFIVIGSIIFMTLVSIFLMFKCIQEFQSMIQFSIDFVDTHLQGEMRDEYHAQLNQAYDYGTHYVDDLSLMKNANLTTKDIQMKVKNMFTTLPMMQSIYGQVSTGNLGVLLNSTALKLAMKEIQQNSYSDNEMSLFSQLQAVISGFLSNIAQNALSMGLSIFTTVINVVLTAFDWIFKIIVFLTVLIYLVSNKHSVIYYLGNTLNVVDPKKTIVTALETCISSTFSVNLRLALFYFFFTTISFSVCGLQIIYIPAILSSLLAILPFVNPMLISVLPAIILWLQGNLIFGVFLFAIHLLASFMIIPSFYEEIKGVDTYFGSLSIALGLYTYGLEGIILGPILMSLIPAGYTFLKYYLE